MITDESLQQENAHLKQQLAHKDEIIERHERQHAHKDKIIAHSDEIIETQKRRIAYLESGNADLTQQVKIRDRQAELHRAIRHKAGLNQTDKVLAEELVDQLAQKGAQVGEVKTVWLEGMAKDVHTSPATVSKTVSFLHDNGILCREDWRDAKKAQHHIALGLTKEGLNISSLELKATRKTRTGKRCMSCGEHAVIEKTQPLVTQTTATCTACGSITIYSVKTHAQAQEPTTLTTEETSEESSAWDERCINDLLSLTKVTCTYPPPIYIAVEQEATTEDSPLSSMKEGVVPPLSAITIKEVTAAPPLSITKVVPPEIKLFLEIAGEVPSHIYMNPRGSTQDDKYKTRDGLLTVQDIADHLDGLKTYGARLLYPHNRHVRAMRFDADKPYEYQMCKEAAIKLAAAGYKPILEPSPCKESNHAGGGALWLVFDGVVETEKAYAAITAIAPELATLKEIFPYNTGNKTRLPAGRYVKQDYSEWCNLYDEAGNCLGHGWEGAKAIVERQTSCWLVRRYKPVEEPAPFELHSEQAPLGGGTCNTGQAKQQQPFMASSPAKIVASEFNATTSWDELVKRCGDWHGEAFYCVWRGDKGTPNGKISRETDLCTDWVTMERMDKYEVWCRLEAMRLGIDDWQTFKRQDIKRRWAARQDKAA